MRGTPWTPEEDEMLRRGDVPPWRTRNAATHRRLALGIIAPQHHWTTEEDEMLTQGLMVPGRSSSACESRRKRLGMSVKRGKHRYRSRTQDPTPEEIEERARLIREERLARLEKG